MRTAGFAAFERGRQQLSRDDEPIVLGARRGYPGFEPLQRLDHRRSRAQRPEACAHQLPQRRDAPVGVEVRPAGVLLRARPAETSVERDGCHGQSVRRTPGPRAANCWQAGSHRASRSRTLRRRPTARSSRRRRWHRSRCRPCGNAPRSRRAAAACAARILRLARSCRHREIAFPVPARRSCPGTPAFRTRAAHGHCVQRCRAARALRQGESTS